MPLGGSHVGDAATTVLRRDLPAELLALEVEHGVTLHRPAPEDYRLVLDREAVRSVDRVALAVSVPGITSPPRRYSGGQYDATYALVVSAFARAGDYADTLRTAWLYAVAVRSCLLRSRTLDGLATDVVWTAEDVAPVGGDASTSRTLALAVVEFDVTVPGAAHTGTPLGTVRRTSAGVLPRPTP